MMFFNMLTFEKSDIFVIISKFSLVQAKKCPPDACVAESSTPIEVKNVWKNDTFDIFQVFLFYTRVWFLL